MHVLLTFAILILYLVHFAWFCMCLLLTLLRTVKAQIPLRNYMDGPGMCVPLLTPCHSSEVSRPITHAY